MGTTHGRRRGHQYSDLRACSHPDSAPGWWPWEEWARGGVRTASGDCDEGRDRRCSGKEDLDRSLEQGVSSHGECWGRASG